MVGRLVLIVSRRKRPVGALKYLILIPLHSERYEMPISTTCVCMITPVSCWMPD